MSSSWFAVNLQYTALVTAPLGDACVQALGRVDAAGTQIAR
jgi:hypothetical protein